jgi:hypothetical protein
MHRHDPAAPPLTIHPRDPIGLHDSTPRSERRSLAGVRVSLLVCIRCPHRCLRLCPRLCPRQVPRQVFSVPELTPLLSHRLSEHPEPEQDDESFLSNFVDDADTVFDPALALNTNSASFSQSQSQSQSQAQAQPQPSGVEPRLQPFAATSGISPDLTQSRTHLPQPLPTALSATGLFPLRGQADDVLMPPGSAPAHASAPDVSGTLPLAPAETAPPTVGSLHSLNMAELLDPADRDVQAFAPKAPFFSISNTGRRRVAGGRNRVGTSNDRDDPGA